MVPIVEEPQSPRGTTAVPRSYNLHKWGKSTLRSCGCGYQHKSFVRTLFYAGIGLFLPLSFETLHSRLHFWISAHPVLIPH